MSPLMEEDTFLDGKTPETYPKEAKSVSTIGTEALTYLFIASILLNSVAICSQRLVLALISADIAEKLRSLWFHTVVDVVTSLRMTLLCSVECVELKELEIYCCLICKTINTFLLELRKIVYYIQFFL